VDKLELAELLDLLLIRAEAEGIVTVVTGRSPLR